MHSGRRYIDRFASELLVSLENVFHITLLNRAAPGTHGRSSHALHTLVELNRKVLMQHAFCRTYVIRRRDCGHQHDNLGLLGLLVCSPGNHVKGNLSKEGEAQQPRHILYLSYLSINHLVFPLHHHMLFRQRFFRNPMQVIPQRKDVGRVCAKEEKRDPNTVCPIHLSFD